MEHLSRGHDRWVLMHPRDELKVLAEGPDHRRGVIAQELEVIPRFSVIWII